MGLSDLFWDMPQIRSERLISGKLMKFARNWFSDLIWAIPRIRSENKFQAKKDPQQWTNNDSENYPKMIQTNIKTMS